MDAVGDEPIHVTEAQRGENDISHDRLAPADRIERQRERMIRRYLVVPVRTDEQNVSDIRMGNEMLEQLEGGRVQPLQVV